MDFLLRPLRRGSDEPLRGVCPAAVPGQQPHPGPEGAGLPGPEAQARPGLQPLPLRPHVGARGLGTGKAEPRPLLVRAASVAQ